MSLLSEIIAAEAPEIDYNDRWRLLKTKGTRNPSRFVFGAQAAREEAEREFSAEGIPVMVISFPPGGLSVAQYVVGGERKGRIR